MEKPLGSLLSPTPSGQHSNSVGGESTPPPVTPVLHFFPTGGIQSGATEFIHVLAQDREEVTEIFFGVDGVNNGEGLLGVWDTADGGIFVLVPGTNVVVLRK